MQSIARAGMSAALVAAIAAHGARAQHAADDLASMNARKLSADELRTLMPETKIAYVSSRGVTYEYEQKSDGSLSGWASGFASFHGFSPGHGTWRVNNNGRYCIDSIWGRSRPFDLKWCADVYQAGDGYFLSYPNRRDEKPLKLRIKKL